VDDGKHVDLMGLKAADDDSIWAFARKHDFAIVSKDSDFYQRRVL
jgi:predicted nuclease of predicted toxin-antitoxin system